MQKCRLIISTILLCIYSLTDVIACDNSSFNLISTTDLGGGQYEFTVEFCAGGGQDLTGYGAEGGTYTWAVSLTGGASFVSYPASLTSPQTAAVYAADVPFIYGGNEYLVYDLFSYPGSGWGAEWWATIYGGWGPPDAYCITFSFITNGMPNQIILGGAEGAGVIVAPYGCSGLPEMEINFGLAADAGISQSICIGGCATISATATGGTSPYTYLWSNGATTSSTTVCPTSNTTYSVTITDALGATDFDDIPIYVNPNPVTNAGLDKTITKGYGSLCATLNGSSSGGSDPKTYSWSNGSTILSPSVCPTATTTYTLTVTDYYGCVSSDNVTVTYKDVRCGSLLNKVYMCKAGNTGCFNTSQVPTKQGQGWVIGACWMRLGDDIIESENPISIFPNPTSENIDIVFYAEETGTALIEIYNNNGQRQDLNISEIAIEEGVEFTQSLNVQHLSEGIYHVILFTNTGNQLKEKFIVIH